MLLAEQGRNRPFARSGHMVRNFYAGTQRTQWDFQDKGKSGLTGTSSFVLEVPLCNLGPSIISSIPCDRILQRAHWLLRTNFPTLCFSLMSITYGTTSVYPSRAFDPGAVLTAIQQEK